MISEAGLLGLLKHILERKRVTQQDKEQAQRYISRFLKQQEYADSLDRSWLRFMLPGLVCLFDQKSIRHKHKCKYLQRIVCYKRSQQHRDVIEKDK